MYVDKNNLGKLSVEQLEALLNKEDSWDDDREIEILPNGEIVVSGTSERMNIKPLTFKENLGGEYANI